MMRWKCLRALSGSVPLLFSWGAARWTSPVGPPLSDVQRRRDCPGSSCGVKRGVSRKLLKKRKRAVCTEPFMQHCWCQYNIHLRLLRLPSKNRQSYKDYAERGNKLSYHLRMSVFAKQPLQKCSCERLCLPRPQKSLRVPITGGLLEQLSPKS